MNITIIGAGNVGATLGLRLLEAGHQVHFGLRSPDASKYERLHAAGAVLAGVEDACQPSDVLLLATPWKAAEEAISNMGAIDGKVLIDATNPIGPGFQLTHAHTDSGGEQVQRWAPSARVVKAFNTTGAENMANPIYPGGPLAMLVCGDDADARAVVANLAADLQFDPVDAGPLQNARLLEPAALLWIKLAVGLGHGRQTGFGFMRR